MSERGWIGVDLNGTLAEYHGWVGPEHIGAPIPRMIERVKKWLAEGREVRIFTARVGATDSWVANSMMRDTNQFAMRQVLLIQDWSEKHIGRRLTVTATKDYGMTEFWDDRAIHVAANTGVSDQQVINDLKNILQMIAEDFCSAYCPSVWKTATGQTHKAKCLLIKTALENTEKE